MSNGNLGTLKSAQDLYELIDALAQEFSRDTSLGYLLTFLRVGMAGGEGIDQGRLGEEIGLSPAGMSRAVRALSEVSYDKQREGFGVVEFDLDPTDNRRRIIRLSPKGEQIINKLARRK